MPIFNSFGEMILCVLTFVAGLSVVFFGYGAFKNIRRLKMQAAPPRPPAPEVLADLYERVEAPFVRQARKHGLGLKDGLAPSEYAARMINAMDNAEFLRALSTALEDLLLDQKVNQS